MVLVSAAVTGAISIWWVELLAVSFCFFANFLWQDGQEQTRNSGLVNNILESIDEHMEERERKCNDVHRSTEVVHKRSDLKPRHSHKDSYSMFASKNPE